MTYGAGADVMGGGMTGDEFAWAIGHREADRIVVDLIAARGRTGRQPFDLDGAVAACAEDLTAYGISQVLGDRYAGAWPVEAFRRHGITYAHSARVKSDLYLNLLPLITMGRLDLPPDPELIKQAKLLERRRGAQGKDTIDHPVGTHDDRINAVALVIAALPATAVGDPSLVLAGPRAAGMRAWLAEHGEYGPVIESFEERSARAEAARSQGPGGAGQGRRGLIL
jgi:hypothetical protein